jgi:DNA-binding transcriptional LysR family regulator
LIDLAHDRRVDLNLLAVLDAIHTQGGVTRAAERLNLTQSAVSHSLSRLREIFGDPLFVRNGHRLIPTPLTRSLMSPLQQVLRSLDLLVTNAGGFNPAIAKAQFTISLRDPTDTLLLPSLMKRVVRAAPDLDFRIVQTRRRSVEADLTNGALDLAIDVPLPLSSHVHRQKLGADRLVVVARKSHPHIRRGLTLETYLAQHHVMVTSRRKGPSLEDIDLSERGLKRRIRLRCRSYFAAVRVVDETDLVLTMPGRYVRALNAGARTQVYPPPLATSALDLYLYWHSSVDENVANRWLRGIVVEAFRKSHQVRRNS